MLKLLCFFVVLLQLTVALHTPVLIWGAKCPSKPALKTVDELEFSHLVSVLLEKHMIVVLLEEQLTTRDFLCRKANTTESCYQYLQNVSPKTYYANVENPIEAIMKLNTVVVSNSLNASGYLEFDAVCDVGIIQLVDFSTKFSLSRDAELELHDKHIKNLKGLGLKDCPVVYMYMSASETTFKSIVRRQTTDDEANESGNGKMSTKFTDAFAGALFQRGHLLVYFQNLTITKLNGQLIEELEATQMDINEVSGEGVYVKLDLKNSKFVSFLVEATNSEYRVKLFQYDSDVFRVSYLSAPIGFSYKCRAIKAYNTESLVLTLHKFQMELFNSADGKKKIARFSKSWDCDGVFSPGLLMGYFTCAFLLGMLFLGICMLLDIRINDKISAERALSFNAE